MKPHLDLVLASTSESRRRLLAEAGVGFAAIAPEVDEAAIKAEHRHCAAATEELAPRLAQAKALHIAGQRPDTLVIGADQVLWMESRPFDKPQSVESAREQLLQLRGRTHTLHTAVACAVGSEVIWSYAEAPELTMRAFSLEYLEHYLALEGRAVMDTVGGYKLEGQGIQLFERIIGDYFAILGLPLLPLLAFLRSQRLLES